MMGRFAALARLLTAGAIGVVSLEAARATADVLGSALRDDPGFARHAAFAVVASANGAASVAVIAAVLVAVLGLLLVMLPRIVVLDAIGETYLAMLLGTVPPSRLRVVLKPLVVTIALACATAFSAEAFHAVWLSVLAAYLLLWTLVLTIVTALRWLPLLSLNVSYVRSTRR